MAETVTVVGHSTPPDYFIPVVQLLTNGTVLPAADYVSIRETNLSHASSATIRMRTDGLSLPYFFDPASSAEAATSTAGNGQLPALDTIPTVDIEVRVGFQASGQTVDDVALTTRFRGMVTHVIFDPAAQRIELQARDYSALLANKQMPNQSWQNMRASDIVAQVAASVGLTADVDTSDGLLGQFRQYEHRALALASHHRWRTAWDFCVAMQRMTGYDLYVTGKTLYFKKPLVSGTVRTLSFTPPSTTDYSPHTLVTNLRLERDMILTRTVSVTVRSWDAKQRQAHFASYPSPPTADSINYEFPADPGTTPDQLKRIAAARYLEVIAHGRTVTGEIHPQSPITVRTPVRLSGTATTFDQTYRVDQTDLTISADSCRYALTLRNRGDGLEASV